MDPPERASSSWNRYATSDSPAPSPSDVRRYEANGLRDQRHIRRRSEAPTPSFDTSRHVLHPPEHFDESMDARDHDDRPETREQNGNLAHEIWQKRRRKRDGYKLLGGMKMQENAADRKVLQRSAVNVLLIGLWYLFSLSISIVRPTTPDQMRHGLN